MAADMKAAAKASKKASKNRQNYLTTSQAKESVEGFETGPFEYPYFDYNDANTWGSLHHPFCTFMAECGYHSIQVVHSKTGQLAFGTYVTEKQNQLQLAAAPYYVFGVDLDGSVITDKESQETTYIESEMNEITKFIEKSQSEADMRSLTGMYYQNEKWKKVRNQERNGDNGGVSVMRGKKRRNLNTAGWSSRVESGHMCWQQYDADGTPYGEATWDPQVDIEAGMKACVTKDSDFFYAAMGPHTGFYDDASWDQHNKEILGRPVTVIEVKENKHVALVETTLYDEVAKADKVVQWHVPGECLEGEPAGDTLLFLGEVGQFVYVAQMDLFPSDTHNMRSKNPNPLFSEWVSLMNSLSENGDDMGFHNCERDDRDNLNPIISGWMAENSEWTYEN